MCLALDLPLPVHGGDAVLLDGTLIAQTTSGNFGYTVGNVELNYAQHTVTRGDGSTVDLAPTEFMLLWLLANADGDVLSRDVLLDAVSRGDGHRPCGPSSPFRVRNCLQSYSGLLTGSMPSSCSTSAEC